MQVVNTAEMKQVRGGFFWLLILPVLAATTARLAVAGVKNIVIEKKKKSC